jgi:G3E family GTPase
MTSWVVEPRKVRAWTTRKHPQADDHDHHDHGYHHGGQIVAVTFTDEAPLVGDRVMAVIDALGARLVRAKGFVNLAGESQRGFVERAGVRTSLELRDVWADMPRKTELVLIGDDLDEAALRRALWACRAGG